MTPSKPSVAGRSRSATETLGRRRRDHGRRGKPDSTHHGSILDRALHIKGESADDSREPSRPSASRMSGWDSRTLRFLAGYLRHRRRTVPTPSTSRLAAAVVVAACGVPVAKHTATAPPRATRGVPRYLPRELGVNIEAQPGVGPPLPDGNRDHVPVRPAHHHPALRFAAPVRQQLPFRTLFNADRPSGQPRPTRVSARGCASGRSRPRWSPRPWFSLAAGGRQW